MDALTHPDRVTPILKGDITDRRYIDDLVIPNGLRNLILLGTDFSCALQSSHLSSSQAASICVRVVSANEHAGVQSM